MSQAIDSSTVIIKQTVNREYEVDANFERRDLQLCQALVGAEEWGMVVERIVVEDNT